ncbi:DNA gyrase subunit A, partial [Acidovorax sp.]|uniref:DNA gyrase subunit A n=1 Tax=Acidovorax sp. TaxID=1872122 RepID=UPI0026246381
IDGQPRLLNLRQMLDAFLRHRREVVTRRTVYDLRKARERGHILEGLAVALANVDEIVELIKSSETPVIAKERLLGRAWKSAMVEEMLARIDPEYSRPVNIGPEFGLHADGYRLSEIQAQRILEMQLQRLTNLESDKIIGEYKEIMAKIADLLDILANPSRITQIIRDELK